MIGARNVRDNFRKRTSLTRERLVAPKGSGTSLRRMFLQGRGLNSSYAIFQDATGKAFDRAIALGIAVGSGYLFETDFKKEVYSDLTGERGTLMGAIYADRFTSRVGHLVLDSAVSPDVLEVPSVTQREVDANARHWGRQFDMLFADFVADCQDDPPCPLGDDTEQASSTVIDLLDSLETAPLPTEFDSLPQLTEGWAVTAIGEGLLDPASWPYLVDALHLAIEDNDATELAWFAMVAVGRDVDGTYPGSTYGKSHLPVTCADWPVQTWADRTPSPEVLEEHPLFARIQPPLPPECAGWTGALRSNLLVRAEPATPVLVIGNERDPVTPIEDTEHLAEMITRSRLVRVDAAVHGAYAMGNACADRVVEDYLARGLPPEDGLECAAE